MRFRPSMRMGMSPALLGGTGTVAPTLSSASSGTPTSDGCTGAGVTTNQGNGTLYWAVVTNGGSCTDAQLKAGAGGNIVVGKAGSQAVSSSGAQAIATITGLTASTTYQIKYLQTNASAQDSSQASVSLTTSAAVTYATWDASDKGSSVTLSGGNLTAAITHSGTQVVASTVTKTSGKWYWEVTYNSFVGAEGLGVGVANAAVAAMSYLGSTANGYTYFVNGQKWNNGAGAAYGNTYTSGAVIGVALDLDNGKVWFSKNGVWQNSGDPAAGTNAAYTGLTGTFRAAVTGNSGGGGNSSNSTANFGATALTYSPPAGFTAGLTA